MNAKIIDVLVSVFVVVVVVVVIIIILVVVCFSATNAVVGVVVVIFLTWKREFLCERGIFVRQKPESRRKIFRCSKQQKSRCKDFY